MKTPLPMNLKVGRVIPCAPPAAWEPPNGAHGVTRPTSANGFRGSRREGLFRGILTLFTVALLALPALAEDLKWTTDLTAAKAQAKKEGKLVLIGFTGSDWCGWCIKLDKEVFGTKQFAEYATKNLVLVKLDFPRKVKQSEELKKTNAALKEQFAIEGFPTLIALNGDGKELWRQVGYLEGGPKAWIEKLAGLK